MAWHDVRLERHGGSRALTGHCACQAVPLRALCLAFDPGTTLWAVFRAVSAREA